VPTAGMDILGHVVGTEDIRCVRELLIGNPEGKIAVRRISGGKRWRSWLKHCATTNNFTGSITDGVNDTTLPAAPMALGSTQPLSEMSTRNIFWGIKAAGA
jgi:hypothetical protein